MVEINDELQKIWFRCTVSMHAENYGCMCRCVPNRLNINHSYNDAQHHFSAQRILCAIQMMDSITFTLGKHFAFSIIKKTRAHTQHFTCLHNSNHAHCSHWRCMLNILWYSYDVCSLALCDANIWIFWAFGWKPLDSIICRMTAISWSLKTSNINFIILWTCFFFFCFSFFFLSRKCRLLFFHMNTISEKQHELLCTMCTISIVLGPIQSILFLYTVVVIENIQFF